jgi:hypothetical protein
MPHLISRHASGFEIRRLMTNRTAHGRQAKDVIATGDWWLMQTSDVALTRPIASWVTIDTASMGHFTGLGE